MTPFGTHKVRSEAMPYIRSSNSTKDVAIVHAIGVAIFVVHAHLLSKGDKKTHM